MSLQVRIGVPSLPEAKRLKSGMPALGQDMIPIVNTEAHLAGYRRMGQQVFLMGGSAMDSEIFGGLPPGPITSTRTHHLPFRVTPVGMYLALRIDYQASGSGTGDPRIFAKVQTMAAPPVEIDKGIEWTRNVGLLPTDTHVGAAIIGKVYEHDLLTIHTPNRIPTPADLAAIGLPRLLDVSSLTGTGGLVDVCVSSEHARLVSVTVEEVIQETIG